MAKEEGMECEMAQMDKINKENMEEIATQLMNVQREAEEKEHQLVSEAAKLQEALKVGERGRISLSESIRQLEKDLDACRTKQEVQEVIKTVVLNNNDRKDGNNLKTGMIDEDTSEKKETMPCGECKIVRNELTREIDSKNQMKNIIQEKGRVINDLKEHSKFADESMAEYQKEKKDLLANIKEMRNNGDAISKSYNNLKEKFQQTSKANVELQMKDASSKKEVKQLLYLNNQLKQRKDFLEEKISTHICPANVREVERIECPDANTTSPIVHGGKETEGNIVHGSGTNLEEQRNTVIRNLCYYEIKEQGSCTRGAERCRFSHIIPTEILQKKKEVLDLLWSKNLCINEFRQIGACLKGGNCRFNHNITADQRRDPDIQEVIKQKQSRMNNRGENRGPHRTNTLCVFELQNPGACRNGKCNFEHDISNDQRKDPTLKDEAKKRMEEMKNRRRQSTSRNQQSFNDQINEDLTIPRNMVKQLYTLLSNPVNGANDRLNSRF